MLEELKKLTAYIEIGKERH